MSVLRRMRGATGIAITWGAAFAGVGAVLGGVFATISAVTGLGPAGMGLGAIVAGAAAIAGRWAFIGVTSGLIFSWMIIVRERGGSIDGISAERFKDRGMLAGVFGTMLVGGGIVVLAGLAGAPSSALWAIGMGLSIIPFVGGFVGRMTAKAILGAARRDGAERMLQGTR